MRYEPHAKRGGDRIDHYSHINTRRPMAEAEICQILFCGGRLEKESPTEDDGGTQRGGKWEVMELYH